METEARASMSNPVTPMAIRASTRLEPEIARRWRWLVDVSLETIARDVSGERAVAMGRSGLPIQPDRHHPHVIAVAGRNRSRADGHGAVVKDARSEIGAGGIVGGNKVGLDEARVVDLVPIVESQRLGYLQHDLRGSQVLPGHLHGEEASGESGEESEDGGPNHSHRARHL